MKAAEDGGQLKGGNAGAARGLLVFLMVSMRKWRHQRAAPADEASVACEEGASEMQHRR